MVTSFTTVAIWMLIIAFILAPCRLVADTMKEDFGSTVVADFSSASGTCHMTPVKQGKLLARRIGTYAVALPERDCGFPLFREPLKQLFVSVSSNGTAKLFFEDRCGNYVSCADFLSGKLSDTSMYWGAPDNGVAAEYGVMRDMMPLLISPRQRQVALMLRRIEGDVDIGKIHLESSIWLFAESCNDTDDVYSRVSENTSDADEVRRWTAVREVPATNRIVGCYKERHLYKCISGTWVDGEKPHRQRYHVLMNTGRYCLVEDDGNGVFRLEPYYTFPWWMEFSNARVCGRSTFYRVRHNELVVVDTRFGTLGFVDDMMLRPAFYQKAPGTGGLSLGAAVEKQVGELVCRPDMFFTKRVCTRIVSAPGNSELLRKLSRVSWGEE